MKQVYIFGFYEYDIYYLRDRSGIRYYLKQESDQGQPKNINIKITQRRYDNIKKIRQ
jgi:hypothetical protein